MDADPSDHGHYILEEGIHARNGKNPVSLHVRLVKSVRERNGERVHCQADSERRAGRDKK
jgi:hypothetical protein